MPVKFLVLGGDLGFGGFFGWGGADFIFMGAWSFLTLFHDPDWGTTNQPEIFGPKFFRGRPRGHVRAKMFVFPGFGGPDRSFWPGVRRDVRLKTSSLGCFFVSEELLSLPIL